MNKVILTGNLVREIELKLTQSQASVVSNCIAVSRDRKEQDGTYGTDFINFVAWNQQADYLRQYARKGDRLEIVGRWQTRQFQDRNGQNQTANEVVVESISCFAKPQSEEPKKSSLTPQEIYNTIPDDDNLPF